MDKQKIKNGLGDIDGFLKIMKEKSPKLMNQLNSIGWIVRTIREELDKPDATTVPENAIDSEREKEKMTNEK